MQSLVINEIWAANEGYMFGFMIKIIKKTRVPLRIDIEALDSCALMGLLQPKDFGIDEQLQIEGKYLTSIF